jgi:hypothetical protein
MTVEHSAIHKKNHFAAEGQANAAGDVTHEGKNLHFLRDQDV